MVKGEYSEKEGPTLLCTSCSYQKVCPYLFQPIPESFQYDAQKLICHQGNAEMGRKILPYGMIEPDNFVQKQMKHLINQYHRTKATPIAISIKGE